MKILSALIVCILGAFIGQHMFQEAYQIWTIGGLTGVLVSKILENKAGTMPETD